MAKTIMTLESLLEQEGLVNTICLINKKRAKFIGTLQGAIIDVSAWEKLGDTDSARKSRRRIVTKRAAA